MKDEGGRKKEDGEKDEWGGGVLEGQLVSVRLFQNGKNIRCLLQEYLFWIFPAIRDVTV